MVSNNCFINTKDKNKMKTESTITPFALLKPSINGDEITIIMIDSKISKPIFLYNSFNDFSILFNVVIIQIGRAHV